MAANSHTIMGGKVKLYQRGNSQNWHCSTFLKGKKRRISTHQDSLSLAKEVAEDWYVTLRGKDRAGLIDDNYRKDPAFDIGDYARRSFGTVQEEPYDVLWRFSPAVARQVHDYHFHPTQRIEAQPDGSVMVRFKAGGWKEMCWHLMTWEGHGEILKPSHLRESYKKMVERLYKQVRG